MCESQGAKVPGGRGYSTVDIANEALIGALVFIPLRGSVTKT